MKFKELQILQIVDKCIYICEHIKAGTGRIHIHFRMAVACTDRKQKMRLGRK